MSAVGFAHHRTILPLRKRKSGVKKSETISLSSIQFNHCEPKTTGSIGKSWPRIRLFSKPFKSQKRYFIDWRLRLILSVRVVPSWSAVIVTNINMAAKHGGEVVQLIGARSNISNPSAQR